MKHCVKFPDDKFLAVRPCLVAICFGNRPAAKLLGALLYRYNLRVENKEDAENQNAVKAANGGQADQDTSYRIFRRQAQLVDDMCGEMTEKTLHDVAVPMLQVLGFLDLEEYMQSNCYIVNIERVQQALNLYSPTTKEQSRLEKFLIKGMQLEKFLITSDELEKFLIDKKNFQSGLEKVLIWNRNISNCKRGRKGNWQARSKGKIRTPKNIKEESKKDKEEGFTYDSAIATSSPALSNLPSVQYLEEIEAAREVVGEKIIELDERRAALSEQDSYSPVSALTSGYEKKEDEDASMAYHGVRGGSTNIRVGSADPVHAQSAQTQPVRPAGMAATQRDAVSTTNTNSAASKQGSRSGKTTQSTGKGLFTRTVTTAQLSLEGQQVRDWYCIIRACKLRMTAQNIQACNNLAEEDGMSFENLKLAIEIWEADKWVKSRKIVIDLRTLEDPNGKFTFEKAMVLIRNRRRPAPAPASEPIDESNPYSLAALAAANPLPSIGGLS